MTKTYAEMNDAERHTHRNPTVWISGWNEKAVSRGEQMKRQGEGKKHISTRFEPFEIGFAGAMSRETNDLVYGGFAPRHDLFHAFRMLFMLDQK